MDCRAYFFGKHVKELDYKQFSNVEVRQGFMDRIYNFGDVLLVNRKKGEPLALYEYAVHGISEPLPLEISFLLEGRVYSATES